MARAHSCTTWQNGRSGIIRLLHPELKTPASAGVCVFGYEQRFSQQKVTGYRKLLFDRII